MDRKAAVKIITNTFEEPFDKNKYAYFVKNLFKDLDDKSEGAAFQLYGQFIPDPFKSYISKYERIGKYEDTKGNKIDALIVYLEKETSLERARTMQRNFVASYLDGRRGGIQKDAAVVAFVSPELTDWRFSLVKMEYHLTKTETGKVKPKQELTPARRFSFLVGASEKSHTAKSQLLSILEDKKNPLLSDLEEAFSVEKVTKEFFTKYRELFDKTIDALDEILTKDAAVREDFETKDVDTANFAKKLLGQVVFLYFLQKKGWFGVPLNQSWGEGPKDFLRQLFKKNYCDYENFFDDILEPLFYEALAVERQDDFYSRFNCKIPFLNGGLFDPINSYDWVNTKLLLPNHLFSNQEKTKEGDIGTGILDVFDRYNFTVKEDEPLEKEVAVDPEMLGKVFENLLEVKDRKSKGTYYTPREIVHYMCQESLINYLTTECREKVSKQDIDTFVRQGEIAVEHDARVEKFGKETKNYSYKLPETIRENANFIDEKLVSIRVCDPAVGSGAFLVGMMNEIIRARNTLTSYLGDNEKRSIYNFKRHAIQNCLYGVDIDPGAVEIAKLRLWLSLVVDEQERQTIQPLPNLDYKIMQGNSLLEEYEGIKLFESETGDKQEKFLEVMTEAEKMTKELQELKKQFFQASHKAEKDQIKDEIENLTWDLIETTLKEQNKEDNLEEIARFKKSNIKPFFLWHLNFSEIFQEKDGFDVVIANPPYIRQEQIKDQKPLLQQAGYRVYNATSDLYTYFYERSWQILKPNGFCAFISSNKWMRAKYGEKLRQFFKNKTKIIELIDFGGHKVFDATVDTNILIFQKLQPPEDYKVPFVNIASDFSGEGLENYFDEKKQTISQKELSATSWTLADEKVLALKKKIEKVGTPLKDWAVKINRGIITGFNEAFIIDTQTKEQLCKEDPKSAEILKPILRGRDIGRYYYKWAGLWLIKIESRWTNENRGKENAEIFFERKYPAVYKHLITFADIRGKGKGLFNRDDRGDYWWELRDCDYYQDFEKEKVVYADIAQRLTFALDDTGKYLANTAYFLHIDGRDKYLLGILNSRLLDWYYRFVSSQMGTGVIRHFSIYIEQLPIPKITPQNQSIAGKIEDTVNKILAITKSDDYLKNPAKQAKVKEYEKQIDQMVYKLYDLTPEEIEIVEGS